MYTRIASASIGLVLLMVPVFALAESNDAAEILQQALAPLKASGIVPVNTSSSGKGNNNNEERIAEFQKRIQELLAVIEQLKKDRAENEGVSNSGPGSFGNRVADAARCLNLKRSLYLEQRDADTDGEVSKLQKFLAQHPDIYPEGLITGYFGPATERAVQKWQREKGIVASGNADSTGFGLVGLRTRASFACLEVPPFGQKSDDDEDGSDKDKGKEDDNDHDEDTDDESDDDDTPTYNQSTYYSQSAYGEGPDYSQGTYYDQGSYYSQASYDSDDDDGDSEEETASVDLKINGSNGPVTVSNNEAVTASWTTNGSFTACYLHGVKDTAETSTAYISGIGTSGSRTVYAFDAPNASSYALLRCVGDGTVDDRVDFTISSQSSAGSSDSFANALTALGQALQGLLGQH